MEIRKYIFLGIMTYTSLLYLRKAFIQRRKMNTSHTPTQNRCWYQKVFQNSIKSSGYAGGSRKLPHKYAEHRLWPSNIYLGKILGPVHIWWYRQLYEYLHRYTQFRIYEAKEYILTSFPDIFGQNYDLRFLRIPTWV